MTRLFLPLIALVLLLLTNCGGDRMAHHVGSQTVYFDVDTTSWLTFDPTPVQEYANQQSQLSPTAPPEVFESYSKSGKFQMPIIAAAYARMPSSVPFSKFAALYGGGGSSMNEEIQQRLNDNPTAVLKGIKVGEPSFDHARKTVTFRTRGMLLDQPVEVISTLFLRGSMVFSFTATYLPDQEAIIAEDYTRMISSFELE